jgi:hypothetical protein
LVGDFVPRHLGDATETLFDVARHIVHHGATVAVARRQVERWTLNSPGLTSVRRTSKRGRMVTPPCCVSATRSLVSEVPPSDETTTVLRSE